MKDSWRMETSTGTGKRNTFCMLPVRRGAGTNLESLLLAGVASVFEAIQHISSKSNTGRYGEQLHSVRRIGKV